MMRQGASTILLAILAISICSIHVETPSDVVYEEFPWPFNQVDIDAIVPEQERMSQGDRAEALVHSLEDSKTTPPEVILVEADIEASIEAAVNAATGSGSGGGTAPGSADPFGDAKHRLQTDEATSGEAFKQWSEQMHAATQDVKKAHDDLSDVAPGWDNTDQVTENLSRDADITDEVTHKLYHSAEDQEQTASDVVNAANDLTRQMEDSLKSAAGSGIPTNASHAQPKAPPPAVKPTGGEFKLSPGKAVLMQPTGSMYFRGHILDSDND